MNLNNIETSFEIEMSPEQLHDLAAKLEHHSKHAFPGQVVRVKLNHNFCIIYRPVFKTNYSVPEDHAASSDS